MARKREPPGASAGGPPAPPSHLRLPGYSSGSSLAFLSARLAACRSAPGPLACGPAARSLAATATGFLGGGDGATVSRIFWRVASALLAIASLLTARSATGLR